MFLKIDRVRDLHGQEVAKRLNHGKHHTVPFFALFDADGALLIDSASPRGNIGYPSGFERKKHLRKMLMETRKNLTAEQIDAAIGTLEN